MMNYLNKIREMARFFSSQSLYLSPASVAELPDMDKKLDFIELFNGLQREHIKFNQLTSLDELTRSEIEAVYSPSFHRQFIVVFLDLVSALQFEINNGSEHERLLNTYFDLVLYSNGMLDIKGAFEMVVSGKDAREVALTIGSDSSYMVERQSLVPFLHSLEPNDSYTLDGLMAQYEDYDAGACDQIKQVGNQHGINPSELNAFVVRVIESGVIDTDALTDLFNTPDVGWKARNAQESALVKDLVPIIKFKADGKRIAELSLYTS